MTNTTPPAKPNGAYTIYPADRDGNYLLDEVDEVDSAGKPTKRQVPGDPSKSNATDIYFSIDNSQEPPPKDQMDLQDDIGQVLDTVRALYLHEGSEAPQFRLFYMRLFRLAQLGLEGVALPDAARAVLDRVTDDLLRTEGPRVKNTHLKNLAKAAGWLGIVAVLVYILLHFDILKAPLKHFGVDGRTAACFMMIWVGCFIGVWLSYAIRKSVFKLRDLTVSDDDFLQPVTRLMFAGLLANVLGLLFYFKVIKVSIGPVAFDNFTNNPTLALLLGILFGVNELLLPNAVAKPAKGFADKL